MLTYLILIFPAFLTFEKRTIRAADLLPTQLKVFSWFCSLCSDQIKSILWAGDAQQTESLQLSNSLLLLTQQEAGVVPRTSLNVPHLNTQSLVIFTQRLLWHTQMFSIAMQTRREEDYSHSRGERQAFIMANMERESRITHFILRYIEYSL